MILMFIFIFLISNNNIVIIKIINIKTLLKWLVIIIPSVEMFYLKLAKRK